MKIIYLTALVYFASVATAGAWEFPKNPDRFPSFGLETSAGKLAGIPKATPTGAPHTDGGFVQGKVDLRLPVSSYITVNLLGESTGINNNLEFSEGHRVGLGVRVYIQ